MIFLLIHGSFCLLVNIRHRAYEIIDIDSQVICVLHAYKSVKHRSVFTHGVSRGISNLFIRRE